MGVYMYKFRIDKLELNTIDGVIDFEPMKALGLGKDDYVVTLSTCTSDESVRFVVQARWVGTYK